MKIQSSTTTFCSNMPRILVTGATGYIGSNLSVKLAKEGYDLAICGRNEKKMEHIKNMIDKVNSERAVKSKCDFVNLELTDSKQVDKFLNSNRDISGVIHLAGMNSNARSLTNSQETYATNLFGSVNLMNSMLESDIRKLLFISTGSVYGKAKNGAKIDEAAPVLPETVYAKSKVMVEQFIGDYNKSGLQSTILRLFNIAGAGSKEDLTIGSNVVSILMNRLNSGKEFVLNGNKQNTPDGTCIRDFLHIGDACEAIKTSFNKLLVTNDSELYNLGSGKGTSIGELIDIGEKTSGKKLNLVVKDSVQYEPPVLVVDNTKIKSAMDWKPQRDIKDIISDAWEWCKSH